jgi:hypothetical protein
MKRAVLVLGLVVGFAAWSYAGRIHGGITEGGKPIARGAKVEVSCSGKVYAAETDAYGAFSLVAAEQGKCTLKLNYQGQAPTFEVTSYDGSAQYDLVLEKQQDGKYTLKRK